MSNYLGEERDLSNIKNVQEIFFHVSKGGIPNNGVATEGGGGGKPGNLTSPHTNL